MRGAHGGGRLVTLGATLQGVEFPNGPRMGAAAHVGMAWLVAYLGEERSDDEL